MVVPYLGFLSDSSPQVFHLLQEKKDTFLNLICEVLDAKTMIKTLQRLVGKCVSSLVVPGARLFTKEMNAAISKGHLFSKLIQV